MYDLILFDLDGTLTYPEEGITKSVQYALEKYGIYEDNIDNLRRFIGPPLVDGFMEFYGMTKEDALRALSKYRERFSDVGIYENELILGADKLLKDLKDKGKRLALATSKPHIYARKILEHFDILKYFEILVGAEFDGTRNEKKDVIAEVLRQAGEYENPVMVGDRKHDAIGARLNNITCIGVSFGFAADGELEENGVLEIADNMEMLFEILVR